MNSSSIKKLLDDVGCGFCLAKWTQVNVNLGAGTTQSCHHNPHHSIPLSEIKRSPAALHNTEEKKQHRKLMLSNQRPEDCNYCWSVEDNSNYYSDRVIMATKFNAMDYYDKIKNFTGDEDFSPTQLEFSFSNVCNFACAYCGPAFSSKWVSDIDRHGPYVNNYNIINVRPIPDKDHNPYIEAFWKYLPEIYNTLHTLRITGGEPLMSQHTYKIFEYIKNNPNENLNLTINTNLGVPDELFEKFVNNLKDIRPYVGEINVATSGEATGAKAEYVRDGLDYNKWYDRCDFLLSNLDVDLQLMCSYNLLSITTFTDFLKDIKRLSDKYNRIGLSITNVAHPEFLALSMAPVEWKTYLDDSLSYLENNFPGEPTDRFKHVVSQFYLNRSDYLLDTLKKFIIQYDQRRNKNFKEIFPEYNFIDLKE